MRILRARLAHYRGIDEREIEFAPRGVTVVVGPNEAGKSSLAEAVDVLFEELDSTTKQRVRAIKPVDRDAGAEVELEVETGPYAFRYAKRFHRDRQTLLRVERPERESWTGREAHERARAILEETLDLDLWRALRVEQGLSLEQPALEGGVSLARALDRIAAGTPEGEDGQDLFDAARAEFGRYFTDTGREKRELLEARAAAEAAAREEAELEAELRQLESDLERCESLARERATLEARQEEAGVSLQRRFADLERVRALENELEQLQARRDTALAQERHAERDAAERGRLAAALAAAEAECIRCERETEATDAPAADARAALAAADRAQESARAERERCGAAEKRARRDLEFRRSEIDLERLEERIERVAAAEREAGAARRILEDARVDEGALERIRAAHLELERARARLEVEGARVRIQARAALEVEIDGRRVALAAGEHAELRVAEALRLALAEAELEIAAGAGAASVHASAVAAEEELRALCAAAGVADLAEASKAHEERQAAQRAYEASERTRAEALRDQQRDALEARALELRARLASYPQERGAEPALPRDLEDAEARLRDAEADALAAERRLRETSDQRDAASAREAAVERDARDARLRRDVAHEARARLAGELAGARGELSDEQLRARVAAAARAARGLASEVEDASERIQRAQPELIRSLAEDARRSRDETRDQLGRVREQLAGVEATLARSGELGLAERLDEARSRHARALQTLRSLERRAAGARLLFETLSEERDAARLAYRAPLRERIEALGREVFGDSFGVELDERLSVVRRSLDGVTLDFEQLSGGAREQIALLTRLACACIVAADGGVPLILDDALGYSDPERLEAMGRVLSAAAADCQIVVLTCVEDRYRGVRGAKIVRVA